MIVILSVWKWQWGSDLFTAATYPANNMKWLWLCMSVLAATLVRPVAANELFGQVEVFDRSGDKLENQADSVVFLEGELAQARQVPPQEIPKVSHKGKQFSPRVLPITVGSTLDFYNDDTGYHNVFSLSKPKVFDLGIYPEKASKLVTFDRPGLVKLYCNIHPKMVSNVLVLNNPYFAVTNSQGKFSISGIPDGEYTVRVWHELSEEQHFSVVLGGGVRYQQQVSLTATKRVKQHKNKFGKNYRSKY